MNQRDEATFHPGGSAQERRNYFIILIIVGLLAGILFFWRLGVPPLENWDEGIHAEVSRVMYRDGAWISMSYRDVLYTAKPPLKLWLTALLFPVVRETEFAVRLWSALAGVGTALLLTHWMWRWRRKAGMALLAASFFFLSQLAYGHAFRTGETDALLVLLITAALYAYWRSTASPRWLLLSGGLIGLGFMTKTFGGVLPLAIAGADFLVGRRWRAFDWGTAAASAGIMLLVALPWHLIESIRHGMAFWRSYVGFHVLDRVSVSFQPIVVPWYWYADIIVRRMYPFKLLVPFALVFGISRWLRHRDPVDRLLLLWIAVVFGVFTVSETKYVWYILPILPALALFMARSLERFFRPHPGRFESTILFLIFGATLYILPTGMPHGGALWRLTPFGYLPEFFQTAAGGIIVAVVGAALLLFLWWILCRRAPRRIGLLTGLATAYILGIALGGRLAYIHTLPTTDPFKAIAVYLQHNGATKLDVYGIDLVRHPAGYFYLRRIPGIDLKTAHAPSDLRAAHLLTTETGSHAVQGQRALLQSSGQFRLFSPPQP